MKKVVHQIENTAIDSLISVFGGEDTLIRAAFKNSYFADPDKVRGQTPYFPTSARYSREHYPNKKKGEQDIWRAGDKRKVTLDDNTNAHKAWKNYTGYPMQRKSGYGLRHIWGHPWDPDAFTAGWNFCYMPFWAGMLTEEQHPLPKLKNAFCQASWNLYFSDNPVCERPDFVKNPQIDLDKILQGQPILILLKPQKNKTSVSSKFHTIEKSLVAIRTATNQSWKNLYKGVRLLQGKSHEPFGTKNVENSSKSTIRKILRMADYDCCPKNLAKLESLILSKPQRKETSDQPNFDSLEESLVEIRKIRNQSWSNLYKAVRMLQDKQHGTFGTKNVENNSKSMIRTILRMADYDCCPKNLAKLESLITKHKA